MVDRSLKLVSEYTRTVLSELQVATIGRVGCGAVNHVRSRDAGVRSDRREMCGLAMVTSCVLTLERWRKGNFGRLGRCGVAIR